MSSFVSTNLHRVLQSSDIIAAESYGKGMPILTAYGLAVMRAMVALFARSMMGPEPMMRHEPDLLVPYDTYAPEVAPFGGYENIYHLRSFGSAGVVIRPDCAIANLRLLVREAHLGPRRSALAVFQGVRSVTGQTAPLFKDRTIWPFLQFNHVAPDATKESTRGQLLDRLASFFGHIGMPVVLCDMGRWKDYSPSLFNAFTWLPDGSLTVVAMAYEVGAHYRSLGGLSADEVAFDVGLTEKVLAVLALQRTTTHGLVLPSVLRSTVVSVDPAHAPPSHPDLAALRWRRIPAGGKHWWKGARRCGAPIALSKGRRGWRRHTRCDGWQDLGPAGDLIDALTRDDADRLERVLRHAQGHADPNLRTTPGPSRVRIDRAVGLGKPADAQFLELPDGTVY